MDNLLLELERKRYEAKVSAIKAKYFTICVLLFAAFLCGNIILFAFYKHTTS